MFYFAYGSNMSFQRLARRISPIIYIGSAKLSHYSLQFNKKGVDQSGKCNVLHTGNAADEVYGVLYQINDDDKKMLDVIEGVGKEYHITHISVEHKKENFIDAFMYEGIGCGESIMPFSWYKHHVKMGAVQAKLPQDYIMSINDVDVVEDNDGDRHRLELSVY